MDSWYFLLRDGRLLGPIDAEQPKSLYSACNQDNNKFFILSDENNDNAFACRKSDVTSIIRSDLVPDNLLE